MLIKQTKMEWQKRPNSMMAKSLDTARPREILINSIIKDRDKNKQQWTSKQKNNEETYLDKVKITEIVFSKNYFLQWTLLQQAIAKVT